jgi:hypothetical protein
MSGSNDEAPDLELSWQTFLGNQPRPPLNTEFVIARSAYIASWYASRAYAARSAPKAPVLLASNEQSAIVRAGEAFVAKFKREPVSASDCAWLNGYVAASGETGCVAQASDPARALLTDWLHDFGSTNELSVMTRALLNREPDGVCEKCKGPIWTRAEVEAAMVAGDDLHRWITGSSPKTGCSESSGKIPKEPQ